jgi:hypothetical protein
MIIRRVQIQIGRPWIIFASLSIHLTLGACLLIRPQNRSVLAFSGLNSFANFWNMNTEVLGILLITLSLLALLGCSAERRASLLVCATLVLPQYSLMLWSLVSDLLIITSHQTVVNCQGMLVDVNLTTIVCILAAITAVAFWHTAAFIERYAVWSR